MTQPRQKKVKPGVTLASLLLSGLLLSACGGSSNDDSAGVSAGIGGTGIVSGTITGFGSVHVNGNRYDTSSSQFIVDGASGAGIGQDDLAVGMVVRLEVETQDGAYTGKALKVIYDDEIEGPVAAVSIPVDGGRTFSVFGKTIAIDETKTIFEDTSFTQIGMEGDPNVPDIVEVSGFRSPASSGVDIVATYVKFRDDLIPGSTQVELRGAIKNLSGTPPDENFQIDGTGPDIFTNAATELDVPGDVLVEDLYVEVKGVIQNDLSVIADEVEYEDEDFDENVDDISLQGIVSGFTDIDADFFIGAQRVNARDARISPEGAIVANGVEVEVEGEIVGGTLIADEVELRQGETKLRTFVNSVDADNNRFEVSYLPLAGTVSVRTNGQTLFKDDTGAVQNFNLNQLQATNFVRVEGQEVNGEVIASIVKRVDPEDLKLEGAIDSYTRDFSITVLGIEYMVDPDPLLGTVFEGYANSTEFFDALDLAGGGFVEIEDDAPPDGVADEVELD